MYCDEMDISGAIIQTVNLEMELLGVWGLINRGVGNFINFSLYKSLNTAGKEALG